MKSLYIWFPVLNDYIEINPNSIYIPGKYLRSMMEMIMEYDKEEETFPHFDNEKDCQKFCDDMNMK